MFRPIAIATLLLAATAAQADAPLVLYFASGSAAIEPAGVAVLDQASRAYREGSPIVMIVAGSTDSAGDPADNLALSQARDRAVLLALIARGIPAERFQLLAKGETDPKVPRGKGIAEPENRRVEITWR